MDHCWKLEEKRWQERVEKENGFHQIRKSQGAAQECIFNQKRTMQQLEWQNAYGACSTISGQNHSYTNTECQDNKMCQEQAGFRKDRGTTEQIFILRNIIEQCIKWNANLYCLPCRLRESIWFCKSSVLWRIIRSYMQHSWEYSEDSESDVQWKWMRCNWWVRYLRLVRNQNNNNSNNNNNNNNRYLNRVTPSVVRLVSTGALYIVK